MGKAKTDYIGRDLSGKDLRDADLTNQVLFQTDLRNSRLVGLKLSMNCGTFDSCKLDDDNVAYLLMLVSELDCDPAWAIGIKALVTSQLGERKMNAINRILEMTER